MTVLPSFLICTSSPFPNYLQHLWKSLLQQGAYLEHVVLQRPAIRPDPMYGWGTLQTLPDLLDLTGIDAGYMPHILTDLRRLQRSSGRTPLFLVDPSDLATQRLIAGSDIPGVLCSADVLVTRLVPHLRRLLYQPHALGAKRPWLGLAPPRAAHILAPEIIPLLAALSYVPSQTAAADLCGVSRSTVQRLLLQLQTTLALPPSPHRCPGDWANLVLHVLSQGSICASPGQ